ncbi:hypothetical protein K490DRAFT_36721 [Saccharata proteae CBS 121410]|uniref:FHA domain-containing protein n=1 Tax=Saccharata proteae CBS 121410 TaxID=1314787 RepID=A0A6A5YDS9_9PEZI|nr:hypothetical protein K490DRAFT_36721 [Saccharata proteae CBS 121410]
MGSPERPASKPSLLPAFEPLSSSPIARAPKRKFEEDPTASLPRAELKYYPTPLPTSSTGILPSSPQRQMPPSTQRALSQLSERNPLCAVPTIELPATGQLITMGRSSNSSDHQLSANRLISRIHISAAYMPRTGEVVIEVLGWNGAKVHCDGQIFELAKGDTFQSGSERAAIMLDVHDTRVLIAWPATGRKRSPSVHSDTTWNDESPIRKSVDASRFNSSPPPFGVQSPGSPSHAAQANNDLTFLASDPADVQVYEDGESGDDRAKAAAAAEASSEASHQRPRSSSSAQENLRTSQTSVQESFQPDGFSDPDEENDPIVHSFGPFGHNLLSRMESFPGNSGTNTPTPTSPQNKRRRPLTSSTSQSPQKHKSSETARLLNESPIKNHVINQLAFSRLHSMPLSIILGNLPTELKFGPGTSGRPARSGRDSMKDEQSAESSARLTGEDLRMLLDKIPCIGEINREGKDAAGQPLENQYYYVPEMDENQHRKDAVVGGIGGTGLRQVRKAHKQYYWKRPRH